MKHKGYGGGRTTAIHLPNHMLSEKEQRKRVRKYHRISEKTIDTLDNMRTPVFLEIPKFTDLRQYFVDGSDKFADIEAKKINVERGVIQLEMKKKTLKTTYKIHITTDIERIMIRHIDAEDKVTQSHSVLYSLEGLNSIKDLPDGSQSTTMEQLCEMMMIFKRKFAAQFKNQRLYWLVPRCSLSTRRRNFGEMKYRHLVCNLIFARIARSLAMCKVRRMCKMEHSDDDAEGHTIKVDGGSCSYCFNTNAEIENAHRQMIIEQYWPNASDNRRIKELAKKTIICFLDISYSTAKQSVIDRYFDVTDESIKRLYVPSMVMSLVWMKQLWEENGMPGIVDSVLKKIDTALVSTVMAHDVCYCMTTKRT